MNMERAKDFFHGRRTAPAQLVTDSFTGEIKAATEKFIYEFPDMTEFLDENNLYDPHHVIDDADAVPKKRPTVPEFNQQAT